MTVSEEKFRRKKSKQPKAVVKCRLQTEYQLWNHVHNEAMPHKLEGRRQIKQYVASLKHSPSGPERCPK